MSSTRRRFWNVRAMPFRAIAGLRPLMEAPPRVTVPRLGVSTPVMQFTSVVFPEPRSAR